MSAALANGDVKADISVQPETDVCATCLETLPVEELGRDGNNDLQCGDCRSVDWSVEDCAAFRAYAMGR